MPTAFEPIRSIDELEALYGKPGKPSLIKETDKLIPAYRAYVEAAPFCALATIGPGGLDCSPRGDRAGFLRVVDERTVLLPDRRGNNRIDSLRNIMADPRMALLLLIPGHGNCLRINGVAQLTADERILDSFAVNGQTPRSVAVIETRAVYFQCARALVRSRLWEPDSHVDEKDLPTAGEILAYLSNGTVGGTEYDRAWKGRAADTLW